MILIETLLLQNNQLKHSLQETQQELWDLKLQLEERSTAKANELEMTLNDLERANQRAVRRKNFSNQNEIQEH